MDFGQVLPNRHDVRGPALRYSHFVGGSRRQNDGAQRRELALNDLGLFSSREPVVSSPCPLSMPKLRIHTSSSCAIHIHLLMEPRWISKASRATGQCEGPASWSIDSRAFSLTPDSVVFANTHKVVLRIPAWLLLNATGLQNKAVSLQEPSRDLTVESYIGVSKSDVVTTRLCEPSWSSTLCPVPIDWREGLALSPCVFMRDMEREIQCV